MLLRIRIETKSWRNKNAEKLKETRRVEWTRMQRNCLKLEE